ncbi:MAG: hypothetical protein JWO36_1499 [Myxococcales bacterium]|nr:hypothetical protein [Myxococcales bacterium]
MERHSKTSAKNVPSLDEAERVVSFVLHDQLGQLAGKVASGTSTDESLREMLGLTIAVVGAAEQKHRSIGRPYPDQWESMERSAEMFTDQFVVKWMANADAELKHSITKHRHRKLTAKAGTLQLVESDRNKRARWAQVTLPGDAPLRIAEEVGEGFGEQTLETEERLYEQLGAVCSVRPSVSSRWFLRTRSLPSACSWQP